MMQSQVDVVVFLNLVRFNHETGRREVLLSRWQDTSDVQSMYCYACGGSPEVRENIVDAVRRIALADLGIKIASGDLMLAYLGQNVSENQIVFVFQLECMGDYEGEVRNSNPEKVAEIRWFDQESWPKNFAILKSLNLVQIYRCRTCASEIS